MADAGYFRGTSADQDNRFSDKEKKLLNSMKFDESLAKKVDMKKVKLDVLKPWITRRTTELLKMEDDVVVEFIFNQLEEKSFTKCLGGLHPSVPGTLKRTRAGGHTSVSRRPPRV